MIKIKEASQVPSTFYEKMSQDLNDKYQNLEQEMRDIYFYEDIIKTKYGVEILPAKEQEITTKNEKKEFILVVVLEIKEIEEKLNQIIILKEEIKKLQRKLKSSSKIIFSEISPQLEKDLREDYELNLAKKYNFDDYLSHLASEDVQINDPLVFFAQENSFLQEAISELENINNDCEEILKDIKSLLKNDKKILKIIKELEQIQEYLGFNAQGRKHQASINDIKQKYQNQKLTKIEDLDMRRKIYAQYYNALTQIKKSIKSETRKHYRTYSSHSSHKSESVFYKKIDKTLGTNYRYSSSSSSSSSSWSSSSSRSGGFSGSRSSGGSSRSGGW